MKRKLLQLFFIVSLLPSCAANDPNIEQRSLVLDGHEYSMAIWPRDRNEFDVTVFHQGGLILGVASPDVRGNRIRLAEEFVKEHCKPGSEVILLSDTSSQTQLIARYRCQ